MSDIIKLLEFNLVGTLPSTKIFDLNSIDILLLYIIIKCLDFLIKILIDLAYPPLPLKASSKSLKLRRICKLHKIKFKRSKIRKLRHLRWLAFSRFIALSILRIEIFRLKCLWQITNLQHNLRFIFTSAVIRGVTLLLLLVNYRRSFTNWLLLKFLRFYSILIFTIVFFCVYLSNLKLDPYFRIHIVFACVIMLNTLQLILYLQQTINPLSIPLSIPTLPFFPNLFYCIIVFLFIYGYFIFLGYSNDMANSPEELKKFIQTYFFTFIGAIFYFTMGLVILTVNIKWFPWVLTIMIFLLAGTLLI